MHWYQFQLRKPKRWGHRAKSDGSAHPKVKGVRCIRETWWMRAFNILSFVILFVWVFMFAIGTGYFLIGYWNIAPLVGVNWSIDQFMSILSVCMRLCFVLMTMVALNVAIFQIARQRFAKRAIAHRCHLCPRCGYSLQSRTDDAQPCPECGQRISRRECVRLWARFEG